MPKRASKTPRRREDENQVAARIIAHIAGDDTSSPPDDRPVARQKNPAAVALGRLGGSKGGKKRAANLTPERRAEIARLAAAARWKKNGGR